jgi:pimeloyl-ACP methyl ester carboxylesterase
MAGTGIDNAGGRPISEISTPVPSYRTKEGNEFVAQVCRQNYAEWAVPISAHFIDTEYGRTFVAETGSRASPPLVILHGMTSNSSFNHLMFDMEWLSQRYNVFSVDTIGDNGWSTVDARPKNGLFYSRWIVSILKQMGIDRPTVMGVSYGAFISLQFGAHHPESVRRILALCPVGPLAGISLSFMPKFLPQIFAPDPAKIGMLFQEIGHIPSTPTMGRVISFIEQNLRLRNGLVIFWPRKLKKSELARIPAPCLCMIGSDDPFENAIRAKRRVRSSADRIQVKIIPKAGHFLAGASDELVKEPLSDPS